LLQEDDYRGRDVSMGGSQQEILMVGDQPFRRNVLQALAGLPLMASAVWPSEAAAQTGGSPVKVETKGLVAKIKFEAPVAGFLSEINEKYKLRVTELTLAPGGHVGEHNHVGPASDRSRPAR
jgi:hypothetical protein